MQTRMLAFPLMLKASRVLAFFVSVPAGASLPWIHRARTLLCTVT